MTFFEHFRAGLLTLAVIGGVGVAAVASVMPSPAAKADSVQAVQPGQHIETVTVTADRRAT